MAKYDDGSIYDDGTKYISTENQALGFTAEYETRCHRLSVRVRYIATLIPGADEAFRIFSIRPQIAPSSQSSFTHEAFIDAITPSHRISPVIKHTGSEFIISNIRLIVKIKRA